MKKNNFCRLGRCAAIFLLAAIFLSRGTFAQGAESLFDQGLSFEEGRDWWRASEKFQEALKVNPAYTEAWFHLAQCVYEMDEAELCLEYIQNAKKYSSGRTDILNLEGFALISLGRLSEAQKIFEDIQKKYPNDIDSRFGLAQLNLFQGRLSGAESFYNDALRRKPGNIKALLSLALISSELGKAKLSERYINQALASHAENPQVYYVASYLEFKRGNIGEAEKKCMAAIQVESDYVEAYALLSLIYFAQGRYNDVIDLADLAISRDRTIGRAWYIKGLSQHKLGLDEAAISTWVRGLEAVPEDEIMRAAFELLVRANIDLEDARRPEWAKYHLEKAGDYAKKYAGPQMRYEYQAALRLDPTNYKARAAFSRLLRGDGFSENYLSQIKFIQENDILKNGIDSLKKEGREVSGDEEKFALVKLSDTVEGYESLLENTLSGKWNVAPFYLDKTRWKIGLYYVAGNEPGPHPETERIVADHLAILFRGVLGTSVQCSTGRADGYGDAYADAHKNGYDYFILLGAEESERDIRLFADMYSARTGTESKKLSVYKTGNNSYSQALLSLRTGILSLLPVRARLLERRGKDVLVDIGRTEGLVKGAKFAVVKRGAVRTKDTGTGLRYKDEDLLGYVTLTDVGEDISEGLLSDTGFYDRVNARDELILVELPDDEEKSSVAEDAAPAADQNGRPLDEEKAKGQENPLRGANTTSSRKNALIEMIRSLY